MFNNNSSKGQTTIELLLILTVSVVILAIIYSIYADQFTGNVSSTELFLARSSVQKIVNASNTAYLSGIGSIIKVEVDFPSSVDFDNSKLSSNIISLKLLGGLDVVGIADINFGGSLRKQYGKQVIYLVFDGNKVNLDYLDFELNQYNISFSTLADTNRKETISVRNNSSSNMSFVIENNFSSPGVNIILSKTEFVLAPNAIEYIDFNFIIAKSAIGNYSGNVVFNTMINDVNISKTVSVSTEVLLEMSELMIYPLNTSFTTTANNSVEKSFSVCNKSLNKIEDIAWSSIGESGDGNIINWILNFSDLTNITELNSGECENVKFNFLIPQIASGNYNASITASYKNSSDITDSYVGYIVVEIPQIIYSNYFKSVVNNNLTPNYFLSNFVKKDGVSVRPTGELDWNGVGRFVLTSDGINDYIDTGFVPNTTSSSTTHIQLYGKFNAVNNSRWFGKWSQTGGMGKFAFGVYQGQWLAAKGYSNPFEGVADMYLHLFDYNYTGLYVDGNLVVDLSTISASSGVSTNSLFLFAEQAENGNATSFANFDMYYAKIFDEGVLVRSYIPLENGCLFEEVNSIEYCNVGEGELVASNVSNFDESLVAYYKFDFSSGTTITDMARGRSANLVNGSTISAKGMWDSNALNLDGVNDYVSVGDLGIGTQPKTLSFWLKPNNVSNDARIISNINNTSFSIRFQSGGIQVWGTTWVTVIPIAGPVGVWTHYVFVFNGAGSLIGYKNGVSESSVSPNENFGSIGMGNPLNLIHGSYYNGLIDEVKIYSRALTSAEILADYNSYLDSKFVDNNIIDAKNEVTWQSLKINSDLNYSFGNEVESWSSLKEQGIDELGVNSNANYLIDNSLIGSWHFNESNNLKILNSKTNIEDGILKNGAITNIKGFFDTNALLLDGSNDFVSISGIDVNTIAGGKNTVAFWMKWNGVNNQMPFAWNTSINNSQYNLLLFNNCFGFNTYQSNALGVKSTNFANRWVHVVAVFYNGVPNSTNSKLYIDGIKQNIYSCTGGTTANKVASAIANFGSSGAGYYFGGKIEEANIWNRELTDQEVLDLYNSQKNYFENIVGLWHLNGDTNDASGNEFHGINNNITFSNGLWDTNAGVFNGSNSGVILNNFPQVFGTDMSVSMWAFFNDDSRGVLFGSHDVKPSISLEKHTDYRLRIYWNTAQIDSFSTNNVIEPNKWQFITYVRDKINNEFNVYVNGKLVHTFSGVGNDIVPPGPFYIGRDVRTGSTVLNGKIEEVILWDKALSAEEILDLFENSSKRIDLEVYSCSDANCFNKTITQEILSVKNNFSYDLSLNDSRYFGWNAYFRKASGLDDFQIQNFSKMPFIKDINIVSIIE